MSRFSLITLIIAIMTVFVAPVSAESGTGMLTITPSVSLTALPVPLLLDTVSIIDAKTISLAFNQAIRVDSIRVRIIDQATSESVKIASITGSTNSGSVAVIRTSSTLTAGASYVLTITSAFSNTDMTIKAGVDSIREFTVPATLSGASLNAPSNPNAVIATTGTITPGSSATQTGALVPRVDTLPATGAPTILLIVLAASVALGLLMIRKRA